MIERKWLQALFLKFSFLGFCSAKGIASAPPTEIDLQGFLWGFAMTGFVSRSNLDIVGYFTRGLSKMTS
jgi:hypothetical protein